MDPYGQNLYISLPNNNSSIQACRLSSGLLAMIYNRFSLESELTILKPGEKHTGPCSLATINTLSPDDGETWPWIREVDTGRDFCGEINWHLNGQSPTPNFWRAIQVKFIQLIHGDKGQAFIMSR